MRSDGPPPPPIANGEDARGILVLVEFAVEERREALRCCAKSEEIGGSDCVSGEVVARLRPEEDGRSSRVR